MHKFEQQPSLQQTVLETSAKKKFHRHCRNCGTQLHVKIVKCVCGYEFTPAFKTNKCLLEEQGQRAKKSKNVSKIQARIYNDMVKLYGAGIHACLLFTTVSNPVRQSAGFRAYSPVVNQVMGDNDIPLLDIFAKAVNMKGKKASDLKKGEIHVQDTSAVEPESSASLKEACE